MEDARRAVVGDVPRIVELAHALRAELRPNKGGSLWLAREAWPEPLEQTYGDLVAREDAFVAVGTFDDAVLGFVVVVLESLRDGSRLGRVTDLYVEPEARAVGVGEALIDAAVACCVEAGCIGVDAVALPGDRAAKNFFEQHAFTARALVMHRRLASPDASPDA